MLTGGCTREELEEAGTDVVLESLADFPAWLDGHLLQTRLEALERDLKARGSVMVAYSGGADSAFLLAAAVRALGPDRVVAATGYSHSLPEVERDPARDFAAQLGVELLTPETHEMEREGYRANGGDRCFFCKAELIDVLTPLAEARGIGTVATGTNADDAVAGFRPGIQAADERGAVAPLRDAGLTKAQVREASHRWGLPTWDKPAAACLSSRVAYGVEVTPHRLARVERAEAAVRDLLASSGLTNLRVRDLGDRASVEVDRGPAAARGAPARGRRGRGAGRRVRRGRRRREGVPLRLDERAPGVSPEHVLAEAAAWIWFPPEARTVDTDEFLLIAYPDHFSDPTVALRWNSDRPADELIDDVLAAAHGLGRESVNFFELGDSTRPPRPRVRGSASAAPS